MRKLLAVLNWFTFTGIPVCVFYFSNLGGFASSLDDAADDITPLLGALVPFVALAFGIAGTVAVSKPLWVYGRRAYGNWRYADERKFQRLEGDISSCKSTTISLYDSRQPPFDFGARAARVERWNADVSHLADQLAQLQIPFPEYHKNEDPREFGIRLIKYLTTLESLAERGDLLTARNVSVSL